jgi:hypothetical protein
MAPAMLLCLLNNFMLLNWNCLLLFLLSFCRRLPEARHGWHAGVHGPRGAAEAACQPGL